MADNNAGETKGKVQEQGQVQGQAPIIHVQSPPQPVQQQPSSHTINTYTQSAPSSSSPPPPPPPQQPTQPPPAPIVQQPAPYAHPKGQRQKPDMRYKCYECLLIVQIMFCVFHLIVGIILVTTLLLDYDLNWAFGPNKNHEYRVLKFFIWMTVFSSVFGLIGAAGEALCCQVTHAILQTFCLAYPFPYFIIPWVIVVGMCNKWDRPRYYNRVLHN